MRKKTLITLAWIAILIGLPILYVLPKPNLESNNLDLKITIIRQTQTKSATYFSFKTSSNLNGVFYSSVKLPKNGRIKARCQNNQFVMEQIEVS